MMCYCSFETGQFRSQETKSVRHVVELFFQVNKSSRSSYGYLKRGAAFTEKLSFENLKLLSMEIPLEIVCLFQTDLFHVKFMISAMTLSLI